MDEQADADVVYIPVLDLPPPALAAVAPVRAASFRDLPAIPAPHSSVFASAALRSVSGDVAVTDPAHSKSIS